MMAKRSWPQSYSRLEWSRFLVCVLSALIVEACADPSLSKLRLASWLPPSHVLVRDILVPWAERVRVATEGRVEIEVMSAPLGQPSVSFDIARDGLADIAYRVLSFIIIESSGNGTAGGPTRNEETRVGARGPFAEIRRSMGRGAG